MTDVEDVIRQLKDEAFQESIRTRILKYFEENPNQVFRKLDVIKHFKGINPNTRSNTIRALIAQLSREGRIGRYPIRAKGFSYYGSHDAIARLKEGLKEG